jgi:hypothetical protein
MPFTVPDVATDVTVPEPLPLKVFQSVDVKYPLTDVVAAAMLIAGVVPPEDTTGAVPVTLATTPVTPEIEPPVIATALASWPAIVPTPDSVWSAFHAVAPVVLKEPSAGVE